MQNGRPPGAAVRTWTASPHRAHQNQKPGSNRPIRTRIGKSAYRIYIACFHVFASSTCFAWIAPLLPKFHGIWTAWTASLFALSRCGMEGLGRVILERETGIEPATNGLGSRYSTIELLPLDLQIITCLPTSNANARRELGPASNLNCSDLDSHSCGTASPFPSSQVSFPLSRSLTNRKPAPEEYMETCSGEPQRIADDSGKHSTARE
jgi:hypothetical protein